MFQLKAPDAKLMPIREDVEELFHIEKLQVNILYTVGNDSRKYLLGYYMYMHACACTCICVCIGINNILYHLLIVISL